MFVAKLLLFVCAAIVLVNGNPQGFGGFGAPRELSGAELEASKERLQSSLTTLAAGDGPNYRISKILSATSQVVSGTADKYEVELIDNTGATKVCNVDIWNQSWLPNGVQVTFNCPNEETVVKHHNAK